MRGVPLRLEIGPKDIEKNSVFAARRDTREKQSLPIAGLPERVAQLLKEIQSALLAKALAFREDHTTSTSSYDEFKRIMEGRPGFVVAPWCESAQCENEIKAETQATVRNIPLDQPPPTDPCLKCGRPASVSAWFAKAY
jgi:prolyl-tRNA synthetase